MPKTDAPANETKADKFRRLANPRLARVIASLESIGKLGTGAYENTAEQRSAIRKSVMSALDGAIDGLEPKAAGASRAKVEELL